MHVEPFPDTFLWGASTSAHQIEGNNVNSDLWRWENAADSPFPDRSGDACDSLHRWEQDLDLVRELGLNAYRFSLEWARIEPVEHHVSPAVLAHYRRIVEGCLDRGITPVVTLHHFTSPQWFRDAGGWLSPEAPARFAAYARAVAPVLEGVEWVCTLNEPNMLAMVHAMRADGMAEQPALPRPEMTEALVRAHVAARQALAPLTAAKLGWTVANQDVQALPGSERDADEVRRRIEDDFLVAAADDDFIGVQAYTRMLIGTGGQAISAADDAPRTLMGWESYPASLGRAVRHTAGLLPGVPVLVTENGIATASCDERIAYTTAALDGLREAMHDVDVRGYLHWSLLDNYEWGSYVPTFGLVEVDRHSFTRTVKRSGRWYGDLARAARRNAVAVAAAAHSGGAS